MLKKGNLLVLVLVAALLAAVWGCRTPAGRSAGQVVDDATVTSLVKARFFEDKRISGLAISVNTFEGQVTLTGRVNTAEDIQRAEEVAKGVNGVKSVNNLLQVK